MICSDILSRLSPVIAFEEKAVLSSQDVEPKGEAFNLYATASDNQTENRTAVEDSQNSMDEWLKQRQIGIDAITTGGYPMDSGHFLTSKDPGMCEMVETLELDGKPRDNLVLDNVDPLLNVEPARSVRHSKCDLENSDCDISLCKSRGMMWDTLSIASRRSDCEVETNNDFSDFNLLSYTFDTTDIGIDSNNTDSPLINKNMNGVVFELDSEVAFDTISINDSSKKTSTIRNRIHEPDGDPLLVPSSKVDKNMNVDEEYEEQDVSELSETITEDLNTSNIPQIPSDDINDYNVASEDIGSLLKEPLSPQNHLEDITQLEKKIQKQNHLAEISNMVGLVAVVTNSTNKAKQKTKIVIKTEKGEQKYEGIEILFYFI